MINNKMSIVAPSTNSPQTTGCVECDSLREEFTKGKSRPELTKTGKILLGITGATFGLVFGVTIPFILPALRKVCLPYVPATTQQVNNVLRLLEGKQGRLIDLGSGDGRIVIEAAHKNFQCEGVELNPWLVWYSRWNSIRQGTRLNTYFFRQDLWKTDLSKYDHIVVFGVECMMKDLGKKLEKELSQQGQIIACRFPLPGIKPTQTVGEGIDSVWLYTRNSF